MCSSCERTYHSFDIDYIIMQSIKIESNHLFRRLFFSQTRKKVYRVWDVVIFFRIWKFDFFGPDDLFSWAQTKISRHNMNRTLASSQTHIIIRNRQKSKIVVAKKETKWRYWVATISYMLTWQRTRTQWQLELNTRALIRHSQQWHNVNIKRRTSHAVRAVTITLKDSRWLIASARHTDTTHNIRRGFFDIIRIENLLF